MFEIVNKCHKFDNGHTYKIMYSVELDEKKVYYLINIKDFGDIKFCYSYDDEMFEEIRDVEVLKNIVKEMAKGATACLK